ncbi:hypothetical protein N9D31_03145, partial [Oligoflexaceae bacterium]|nr:hypothetical protein [Oligoflexaceae bacterium]
MNNNSRGILLAVVGIVVGVGGTFMFQNFRSDDSNDASSEYGEELVVDSDTGEEEYEVSEDESAGEGQEEESADGIVSPMLPEADANYDQSVSLEFNDGQEKQVIYIKLQTPLDVVYDQHDLSADSISIANLNSALSGRWVSRQQFNLTIDKVLAPDSEITIDLKSLPISNSHKVMIKNGRGLKLRTPPIQIKAEVSDYRSDFISISLNSNFPMTLSGSSENFKLINIETGKEIENTKVKIDNDFDERIKKIFISGKDLPEGLFSLVVSAPALVDGKKYDVNGKFQLLAKALKELKITTADPQEGASYFSIKFQCQLVKEQTWRGYNPPNNPCVVNKADANDYIQIEPSIKFNVVSFNNQFRLVGKFRAGENYKVTLLPGLTAKYNSILKKKVDFDVKMPNYEKKFSFVGKARYLPISSKAELAFESRNITDLHFRVRRIFQQNIVFWLTSG